jgi:hypothetical protein
MHEILNNYGGLPKLKMIIQSFRKNILATQEVKHFLFSPNFEKLYSDQVNFIQYIFPKTENEYRNPIKQTASDEYRIPTWQFEQVTEILQKTLREEYGILTNDVIPISSHILEIVEESRAQSDDMHSNIWKPADVNLINLKKFYESQGFTSTLDYDFNQIKILNGLPYPIHAKIIPKDKTLQLFAVSSHDAGLSREETLEVTSLLAQQFNRMSFDVHQNGQKNTIHAQHILPYQHYVPTRLLLRLTKMFSAAFIEAHDYYKIQTTKIRNEGLKVNQAKNQIIIDANSKSIVYKDSPGELIKDLIENRLDEMLVLALFENHFNVTLKIQHGDINRYTCKVNDKIYSYEFHELKKLLVKKLEKKSSN